MAEHRVPVRTYLVQMLCEATATLGGICGGEMQRHDSLMAAPGKFEHRCLRCGRLGFLEKEYPRVEYRATDQQELPHRPVQHPWREPVASDSCPTCGEVKR